MKENKKHVWNKCPCCIKTKDSYDALTGAMTMLVENQEHLKDELKETRELFSSSLKSLRKLL